MRSFIKNNPSKCRFCVGFTIIFCWIIVVIPILYFLPSAISFLIVPLSAIPFIPLLIKWYFWVTDNEIDRVDGTQTPVVSPLQTGNLRVNL